MVSPRRGLRDGRPGPTSVDEADSERDRRKRRPPHHERERGGRDRRRDGRDRRDEHHGRHGHDSSRGSHSEGGHRDREHGHHRHGHGHGHGHGNRSSREQAVDRSRDHHRREHHVSSRHGPREDRHDGTQMVLVRTSESGRQHGQHQHGQRSDVHRDPHGDRDGELFFFDTHGDALVWQFGANDPRKVPTYHRYRHGRVVLGAPNRFIFDRQGIQTVFSVEPPHESLGSIFRDKKAVSDLLRPPHRHGERARKHGSRRRSQTKTPSSADKILLVDGSRKRKRHPDSDPASDSDGSGSPDASEGDADSLSRSDDEADDSSRASSDEDVHSDSVFAVRDSARDTLKHKLADLSRHVKDAPHDVDAWLELVDLQDQQHMLLGHDTDQAPSASVTAQLPRSQDEAAGIAAVKLSMLESALRAARSSSDRQRLQLAIMRESAKVCTSKQLAERWDALARESASDPGLDFLLWKARLDFEMTNLSTLAVDGVKRFLVDRLRALQRAAAAAAAEQDETGLVEIYSEAVYVFLRATRFLYDAGFRDHATASWQAMLEACFARPPVDVDGASLGQFWDSEVPRLGEQGARGWCSYAAKRRDGEDADDVDDALLDHAASCLSLPTVDLADVARQARADGLADAGDYRPLYEAWVVAERQRARLSTLPARVMDDVDDGGYDDVFRVVVFADLEALVFAIPSALLPALQPVVIDAFLLFCQLPPAFAATSWIDIARNDPFLAVVVLSSVGDDTATAPGVDGSLSAGRSPPDLAYDGSRVAMSPELLFALPDWFRYFPRWLCASPQAAATEPPVPPLWVATTLRQLVRLCGFGALAAYSLAVDAAVNPAGTKKAARSLLKQYISNTALYEAYALAELARGHADVAGTVLSSAAAGITNVDDELPLRLTWAWLELERGRPEQALRCLLLRTVAQDDDAGDAGDAAPDNDGPVFPAELLRQRHALRRGMEFGLSAGHVRRAARYAQSFVLLEYLSSAVAAERSPDPQRRAPRQGNVAAALAAAASFSGDMQARGHEKSAAHELFLQSVARIVYSYARHGPYRPVELQPALENMVVLFPQNGLFLRLFAWIDPAAASGLSRLRPDDPVRRMLDDVVLVPPNDCPSSRAFAIRHALQSGSGGGSAAARAAFERALGGGGFRNNSAACLGSARLWQAFVHLTATEAMAAATRVATGHGTWRVRGVDRRMVALAKDVFYRAVRACPGAKDVYLEAFGPATGLVATSSEAGMSPSDLRSVFQTLVGKGLRVHLDLAGVLDGAEALSKTTKRP